MQKIAPNLWCTRNAEQAAQFYCAALPDTQIVAESRYPTEGLLDFQRDFAGEVLTVEVEVAGYRLSLINAGEEFHPNGSISFLLNFDPGRAGDAAAQLDRVWERLADGGSVVVPLGSYPHSERFGWVEDKFGVNWQLMLTDPAGEDRPFLTPMLLFSGPVRGRAAEAVEYYERAFPGTTRGQTQYVAGDASGTDPRIAYADFTLLDQWFAAMDSRVEDDMTFTPGVSLVINCDSQEEIDRYWEALSAVPEAEQCGWCADRFGVSWQIVPSNIEDLMKNPDAFSRMLEMKKLDIAGLAGEPTMPE